MGNVKLDKYDKCGYNPGNKVKRILWHVASLVFFKSDIPYPYGLKIFLLKRFGAKIGQNITIKAACNIKYPWFLEMGDNVWIGENAWIDNLTHVKIGNNVCISQGSLHCERG